MTEDVEPWLLEKMIGFLGHEDLFDKNVEEVFDDGITAPTQRHKEAIQKER